MTWSHDDDNSILQASLVLERGSIDTIDTMTSLTPNLTLPFPSR